MCYSTTMPSLAMIGQQIKEKQRGEQCAPSAYMVPKYPCLNSVKSNFSSNSQMAITLESLSSMVHFPFNHVKELDLGHNCAKRQVKAWGRSFSTVI